VRRLCPAPRDRGSPDGTNVVTVSIDSGTLRYAVRRNGANVLMPSALGFAFRSAPRLKDNLRPVGVARSAHDETWTQPWGEVRRVRDHHNELRVTVEEARTFTESLSFLTPGKAYVAQVYADGKDAHFLTNPTSVAITKVPVTSASKLAIAMATGGGQAIRIRPAVNGV